MHSTKWNALLAVVAASGLFFMGCPKDPDPIPDAGPGEVDAGPEDAGVEDAGPEIFYCETDSQCQNDFDPGTVCDRVDGSPTIGTCVPRCDYDDMCAHYQVGLRCDIPSGHCILGQGCTSTVNCGSGGGDLNHYCDGVGQPGCRCVRGEDHPDGFGGVCRRRLDVCQECQFDEECGSENQLFDPQGRCRALQGDPNGTLPDGGTRKYCFQAAPPMACPCGMTQSGPEGLCIPQSNSCDSVGCNGDDDCPFGSVCGNDGAACGLCEPRCRWNFDTKQPDPPGCGPKTCWVDPENLDPSSPFFGAGRCRPPCVSDAECQQLDPDFICRGEPLAGGGTSEKRCRPKGECMDDFECPEPLPEDKELGYCDRQTFTCKKDCRTGTDPTTNQPYDDCTSGYKCVTDVSTGTNKCEVQTCLEQGGGRIACPEAHYCAGEDKNMDGVEDGYPMAGLGADKCYLAGRPPFCQTCESHADCAGLPNPAGSPLPHMCVGIPPQQMGDDPVFICGIATHNRWDVDASNISPAHRGCPARFTPTPMKVRCPTGNECGPNGLCDDDPFDKDQDGNPIKTCLCQADNTSNNASMCPANAETGIQSVCRHAPSGTTQYCVESVVCLPGTASVYKPFSPPSSFGCGISPP